ncbi:MAG: septum formation protein Maf [Lachnospiraceae bacterium]|nr:septum formation protein Maf [Lachnospiraceae bacterium]
MKNIILASQSPRRKELLAQAGFSFEIITSDVEEIITHTKPWEIAESLSSQKAEDVFNKVIDKYGEDKADNYLVIGADTIVAIEDRILGKPKDRADAYDMMKLLSGKTHQVYTGVTVVSSGDTKSNIHTFNECTDVTFYEITDDEINEYLDASLEWSDKAGAYGIQATVGAKFVKEIKGDYNNVVGLPIARLYQVLKEIER